MKIVRCLSLCHVLIFFDPNTKSTCSCARNWEFKGLNRQLMRMRQFHSRFWRTWRNKFKPCKCQTIGVLIWIEICVHPFEPGNCSVAGCQFVCKHFESERLGEDLVKAAFSRSGVGDEWSGLFDPVKSNQVKSDTQETTTILTLQS